MAPASASPQPPAERSDTPQSGQLQRTEERHEVYGLLDVERRVKDDGRGLILYARQKHEGR